MSAPLPIVEKLRAPSYWMSGSSDGHEGENDKPREAADIIEELYEALERLREWERLSLDERPPLAPILAAADSALRKVRDAQ